MESTDVGGADRPLGTDVLGVAAFLRWSRPDLTAALSEYRSESAAAESDREVWLAAAGWRLYAAAATGDGREVASDVLDGLTRWGPDVLRVPAAGRLRIELAVLAHDSGETQASRELLHAVPVDDADREFAADVLAAAARCTLADGAPSGTAIESTIESTLAPALGAWAAVGGVRGELGAAAAQAVGAAAARRGGHPEVAVRLAVDGLSRLDRGRVSPDALTPSGHLAAALAAEWIAALIEAGRPEQARAGSGPLQDRLVEYARPSRQLALLRLTIARATASQPRPQDPGAVDDLERAAADAAASDVPALEHVCRTALGELYEAGARPAESVESIRRAVEADRRHRSRETRFRAALAHTEPFWRVDTRHTHVPLPAAQDRDAEPAPEPINTRPPSKASRPPANTLFASDASVGPGRPSSTNGNGSATGVERTAILRAVQAAAITDREERPSETGGSSRAAAPDPPAPDPWATGTWSAARSGQETGTGVPSGTRPAAESGPAAPAPTGVRPDRVEADVVAAAPDAVEDDPVRGTDTADASPGTGAASSTDPDTWLATALAELDRIGRSGDDPADVPDDTFVAVESGDCVVVLDLAMAGERLAAEAAAPTVRRLVRRLEDRLPPAARLRDDGPDTVSVVLPGRDRESAAEWLHRVLPDLVDGLAVDAAAGGALLRAAVHDADGTAGGQILQQLDGTRGRNGAATQEDRPAARPGVEHTRPGGPTGTGSPGSDGGDAGRRAVGERDSLSGGLVRSVVEIGMTGTGTPENGSTPDGVAGSSVAGPEIVGGAGSEDPAQGLPTEGGVRHGATDGATPQSWTPPAAAQQRTEAPVPAARRERVIHPRPEPRHDQSGGRRPYLPAGVIVRPGTGGRRHRRAEEPAIDDAERGASMPGPAPTADSVPVAAPGSGRPSPGPRNERRPAAGPPNGSGTAAQPPTTGSGLDARSGTPAEAPSEEPDDLGLPSPDGLGLADLLAGALAAYRRI